MGETGDVRPVSACLAARGPHTAEKRREPPDARSAGSVYARSLADPEGFWAEAAEAIDWDRPLGRVLDARARPSIAGSPAAGSTPATTRSTATSRRAAATRLALIYDSPVTGTVRTLHLPRAARRGGALRGRARRQRASATATASLIYMPMVPEAVIAMLACARIGAIHSVVFGGFAPHELATRIDDARPQGRSCSASCGIEVKPGGPLQAAARRGDRAGASQAGALRDPAAADVRRRRWSPGRDHDWARARGRRRRRPTACRSPPPIRSTSSTPRAPPASPRASCATMAATRSRSPGRMRHIYGVEPGEVFWAASDVGWVVGHSYIVYAPLLHGSTTVLYEGKPVGTPDAGAFWRVIAQHGVGRVLHRADRVPRHQARRSRRRAHPPLRPDRMRCCACLASVPVLVL